MPSDLSEQIDKNQLMSAIASRRSIPHLMAPAPSAAVLERAFAAALCAPDHGRLHPWQFWVVEGDARVRLGEVFLQAAQEPSLSPEACNRFLNMPLRAPMLLVAATRVTTGTKIPVIEQQASLAAAIQNLLLVLHAQGFGAIWRTGNMASDPTVKRAFGLAACDEILGFIYVGTPKERPVKKPLLAVSDFVRCWDLDRQSAWPVQVHDDSDNDEVKTGVLGVVGSDVENVCVNPRVEAPIETRLSTAHAAWTVLPGYREQLARWFVSLQQVPLTQALGVQVLHYDGLSLGLTAPYLPNSNDKHTVFGGSLSSLALLAGWGIVVLSVERMLGASVSGKITAAVTQQTLRFLQPLRCDFIAVARVVWSSDTSHKSSDKPSDLPGNVPERVSERVQEKATEAVVDTEHSAGQWSRFLNQLHTKKRAKLAVVVDLLPIEADTSIGAEQKPGKTPRPSAQMEAQYVVFLAD